MNEELNGQVCELCKMFVAKPEKYAGATWLCEVCTPRKKHQTVIVKGETINDPADVLSVNHTSPPHPKEQFVA